MMNEYRILEKMATGSFGVVFKVRRVLDDSVLVMKRIALTDLDAQQRKDAAQEVRVMSRLHHPFIVAQRDAFLFNDSLCIVMDYYDGGDLAALITRQREKDEYFSLEQVMPWFAEVNMAIHYLHTHGIVHRDLKTHNLFLVRDSKEVAVGDFGVAEFVDPAEGGMPKKSPFLPTLSPASQRIFAKRRDSELFGGEGSAADGMNGAFGGAVRGTLLYMAPEVLETGVCSPSSDVWALGCILYELLNLYHPFESRDVAALMMRVMAGVRQPLSAHYPTEITELVDHMLALDAKQRPSCEEILRSPMMNPYVRQIVRRRALGELGEEEAERVWEEQLQTLGINKSALSTHLPLIREKQPAMPPSQARVMSEKFAVMSPGSDFQLSPRTSTFGDESVVTPHFAHPMRLGHEYHGPLSHANNYSGLSEREREDNDQSSGGGGLFFPSWGSGITNVEDMLNMPLELVEAEVERYRQLVQNEMREQKRRRDAAKYKKRFGENTTPTMQYYNSLLQVEQVNSKSPVKSCIDHKVEDGGSVPPLYSSFSVSSHLPSGSSRRLESICMSSGKWPQGSLEASLTTRRQQRIEGATQVLGESLFLVVYLYYKSVDVTDRDVTLMMDMVPDRSHWHALPMVEEIVVIDRLLERVGVTDT